MARISAMVLSVSLRVALSMVAIDAAAGFAHAFDAEGGKVLCGQPTPFDGCSGVDMAASGVIDVDDLLVVINHWGQSGTATGFRPPGDCAPFPNGNCNVNVDDLIMVISYWGVCDSVACCLPNEGCVQMNYFNCGQRGGIGAPGSCYNQSVCPTAQPNDNCEDASTVFGEWYNLHATTDGPAGEPGNQCEELMVRDLWYRATVNCPGVVEFTVGGYDIDKIMAVYDGWSCPPGKLLGCVRSTENASLILDLPVGQQVTIRVGTTDESPTGQCYAGMSCHSVVNDDCAAAITSPGVWSNLYATTDGPAGEPGNKCESILVRDLWYRHTNPCATFTRYSLGGIFNHRVMAIYDGWTCPPGPLLGCVEGTGLLQVTLDLNVGQQVLIRVGTTADSEETIGNISWNCVSSP